MNHPHVDLEANSTAVESQDLIPLSEEILVELPINSTTENSSTTSLTLSKDEIKEVLTLGTNSIEDVNRNSRSHDRPLPDGAELQPRYYQTLPLLDYRLKHQYPLSPTLVPPFRLPLWFHKSVNRIRRQRYIAKVETWLNGPEKVQTLGSIKPFFPRIEYYFQSKLRIIRSPLILWPYLILWISIFAYLINKSQFSALTEFGAPVDFTAQSTFWLKDAACGLNGENCEPFSNTTTPFRCSASALSTQLLNDRAVGDQELIFQPLVVGGGDDFGTYRGDSFICQAAIHHGLFSNNDGGCGVVTQTGTSQQFIGSLSNGINSTSFSTIFPSSFQFSSATSSNCKDLHTEILIFNVFMLFILVFILRPPPLYMFWAMVVCGFWHEGLVSQTKDVISACIANFFPTVFFAYGIWRSSFRFALPYWENATLEKSVLYLGPFWVGLLSQYTFNNIPIQRLIPQDIHKQPGGVIALVIICIVLVILALNQIRLMRSLGCLPTYLTYYIIGGIVTGLLCTIPGGFQFRLHHWLIALVLLPACAFPTRLDAIYQGLLLGLFLNDAATFGFDGILETTAQLLGDGQQDSALPSFLNSTLNWNLSQTFTSSGPNLAWNSIPENLTSVYDSFILLIDDVERYAGNLTTFLLTEDLIPQGLPHYFRLAYSAGTSAPGDFTRATTILANDTLINAVAGPS